MESRLPPFQNFLMYMAYLVFYKLNVYVYTFLHVKFLFFKGNDLKKKYN